MKNLYIVIIYRSNGNEEEYSGILYNSYDEASPELDEANIYFPGMAFISNRIIEG